MLPSLKLNFTSWDQAELTRWQPGFAGKRAWSTVRKHLLLAAENKIARGNSLRSRLYIPEVFSVDQRDAINARRMAQWSQVIATFSVAAAGIPTIAELSLMPVTRYWLPVEDGFEKQLIERLVADGQSFVKGLRFNLPPDHVLASAVLIDVAAAPIPLCIAPRGADKERLDRVINDVELRNASPTWVWHVSQGTMPPLPSQSRPPEAA